MRYSFCLAARLWRRSVPAHRTPSPANNSPAFYAFALSLHLSTFNSPTSPLSTALPDNSLLSSFPAAFTLPRRGVGGRDSRCLSPDSSFNSLLSSLLSTACALFATQNRALPCLFSSLQTLFANTGGATPCCHSESGRWSQFPTAYMTDSGQPACESGRYNEPILFAPVTLFPRLGIESN